MSAYIEILKEVKAENEFGDGIGDPPFMVGKIDFNYIPMSDEEIEELRRKLGI